MSFMDIMNIMKVSSSKFVFTLIAVAALFVGGSGIMAQDAYAANAPTFTAIHHNTTLTQITFDQNVNGTLRALDWAIKAHSCDAPCLTNTNAVAGPANQLTDYAISNIINSTAPSAPEVHAGTEVAGHTSTATALNILHGHKHAIPDGDATGFGFINTTNTIYLVHAAIPSDATYFINYTGNLASSNNIGGITAGSTANAGKAGTVDEKLLKVGTNATGVDWMGPSATSAEVLKSNPSQIKILMSENISNVNSSAAAFTMTTAGGGNKAVPVQVFGPNGTNYFYVNLQNPARVGDVLTIAYSTGGALDPDASQTSGNWITDTLNSERFSDGPNPANQAAGVGNRIGNFTLSITNWIPIGLYGNDNCYDCLAPTVTKVEVSLDGSTPVTVTNDNPVQINAGNGDTVSVIVTVADNVGADTLAFAGLYTNFGGAPDNLYYSNNFDSFKQMSTSYYEWNARSDNTAFGNTDEITWDEASATINPDRTQTITYTMTINDQIESTQVWVDLGDKVGNYAKLALPITLEVAGPPAITFASDDSQKVVSYFNESILLAIVSQWTATSSDDVSNVEQLSSVLGIEDQLPTWTTSLASWASDDKIDIADMIVAVEYVINQ